MSSAINPSNLTSGVTTADQLAPRISWPDLDHSTHFVQFYETGAFLHHAVSGYLSAGLHSDDGCIVVATQEQRDGIEEKLRAGGIDLTALIDQGRYVSLDAADTLSRFMINGVPEWSRFSDVVGATITRAAEGGRSVRIFGEMVALLWAEGNLEAALDLEKMWNDLHKSRSFSLFCAYPMNGFGGESMASPLKHVCAEHSAIIPAESYNLIESDEQRLRAILHLQQKAKSLEREIVERERLLVAEQIARAEAESANRLKDEFLATVSHELRTPLNAIMGWAHMLLDGRLDKQLTTRAVETIERNARLQAQLIEDILDVSRVITGKLRLNIGQVDVASVINAAIDSVQLAADSKGLQLEVRLDPSARHVAGDSSRLQQVVWNLLSNAIKFTPAGGSIRVGLERVGHDAQITVSDSGEGISPEFLPFIFDRFRQADGTSTRRQGGLGLGLAIVRHLVELHGGSASAHSAGEGGGATFTIKLPFVHPGKVASSRARASEDNSPEPMIGKRLEPLPSLRGVRVLVVDDDVDSLNLLTTVLSENRATVEVAATVAEALQILEWYDADVLVSDLAMPDEDGCSLITKIRMLDRKKQLPAVALTAYVRIEDRTRALSAGFNMFVPKPVQPNELITVIGALVEGSSQGYSG